MLVKSARFALAFAGLAAAASIAGAQGATIQGQSSPAVSCTANTICLYHDIDGPAVGSMDKNASVWHVAKVNNEWYRVHLKHDADAPTFFVHTRDMSKLRVRENSDTASSEIRLPVTKEGPAPALAEQPAAVVAPRSVVSRDSVDVQYRGTVDLNVHGDVNTHGSTEKEGGRSALETTGLVIGGVALAAGATCGIMAIFRKYCFQNINNNYNDGRQPSKDRGFGVDVLKLVQFVTDPKRVLKHQ